MIRPAALTLIALSLVACGSNIEDAKIALKESIVIKTDLSVDDLRSYPGGVVCGAFTAYISYHDPRKENAPFIYRDEKIDRDPQPRDWKVFCSEDPAASLAAIAGFGPITRESAEWLKIIADFASIESALEDYYEENHSYPQTEQGLAALKEKPESRMRMPNYREGGYLNPIPTDPWGRPYVYKSTQWGRTKGTVEMISLGRDGEPGGEGLDADVSSELQRYLVHIDRIL
ncbi:type II secretion system major pseudopilin GspG [Halioglobus maricola]|uniref:type II secretion system major pseudopilin GspG n=1 Tax=Halioglobus maricola TaxID=2601894 RepID=UPI00147872E6|nr:type II secretion system major pseudopilin GspG [Halioglobus maricola]